MWSSAPFIMLWLLSFWIVFQLLQLRQPGERVKISFSFPAPSRANMKVFFTGKKEVGPFFARVTLLGGKGLALKSESKDPLAEGKDTTRVTAPMVEAAEPGIPLRQSEGRFGIECDVPEMSGRLHVEVLDGTGRSVAAQTCDF